MTDNDERVRALEAEVARLTRERDEWKSSAEEAVRNGDVWRKASHEGEGAMLERDAARARVAELEGQKDGAYRERDTLVAALSKVFPSSLERHPDADAEWEDDWRTIIAVNLPTGQATWHVHDSEREMFTHLRPDPGFAWDGHTTEEKYARVRALAAREVGK